MEDSMKLFACAIALTVLSLVSCNKATHKTGINTCPPNETALSVCSDTSLIENTISYETDCCDSTNTPCSVETSDCADESKYAKRKRKQIELMIPNAKDTISAALDKFSPEFQDWVFYISIDGKHTIHGDWTIVGEPGTKRLDLFLEEHFMETIGYITIGERDLDIIVYHNFDDFEGLRIDSLIKYTGIVREFVYATDYPIICDGDVEYRMRKTDQGLKPYQKIESW